MAKKYYRSTFAGLEVQTKPADVSKGEVAPHVVKFEGYEERWDGDKIKVGYLETDDEYVQAVLDEDQNVDEIDKDVFAKATGKDSKKLRG